MDRTRLFLSAVSQEFRTARGAVAATVRTLGYDPVSQDDFPTGHGDLRDWLREVQQVGEEAKQASEVNTEKSTLT